MAELRRARDQGGRQRCYWLVAVPNRRRISLQQSPERRNDFPENRSGGNLYRQNRRQPRRLAAAHPSELEEGVGDRWPSSEEQSRWLEWERKGERPQLGFLMLFASEERKKREVGLSPDFIQGFENNALATLQQSRFLHKTSLTPQTN